MVIGRITNKLAHTWNGRSKDTQSSCTRSVERDASRRNTTKAKTSLEEKKISESSANYAWHIDGYNKLKHWGFPIHGAIDGFSRKILWLEVARSNNSPHKIVLYYVWTASEQEKCPEQLITDLGTENGLAAAIQTFFHDNPDAHHYVASPRNLRIEGWWSFYSKSHSKCWKSFFNDLEFQGTVDTLSEMAMKCLWYCFNGVLKAELDAVKERWNTHRIWKSRNDTVPGRPDSLFLLPELHGACDNGVPIAVAEVLYVTQEIIEDDHSQDNEYQEYFDYARRSLSIPLPNNWEGDLSLYTKLMHIATHGQ